MLRREILRDALCADCSDEDVALACALLTPEPRGPHSPTETSIRTTLRNFGRIPRFYIELTQDKAVSWAAQKRMYGATPCAQVLSIKAYFSRPDELTKKILHAGENYGGWSEGMYLRESSGVWTAEALDIMRASVADWPKRSNQWRKQ